MKGAEYTKWGDPLVDGIMLHIRGSKTDQYNLGCLRYVGKTSTTRCAVKAMLRWHAAEPEHFSRVGFPMFSDALSRIGDVSRAHANAAEMRRRGVGNEAREGGDT